MARPAAEIEPVSAISSISRVCRARAHRAREIDAQVEPRRRQIPATRLFPGPEATIAGSSRCHVHSPR